MRRWGFVLLLIGGCSDPATSRLAVGSKALAIRHYNRDDKPGVVFLEEATSTPRGMILPSVAEGTHVTVIDDTAEPDRDWGTRKVKVHVEEGDCRGITGMVSRAELHPER